jgi:hypothetical protein
MPDNKREPKRVRSFRLSWVIFELLKKMSTYSGMSEGQIVEAAIGEYFRNHPEYWPKEKGDSNGGK